MSTPGNMKTRILFSSNAEDKEKRKHTENEEIIYSLQMQEDPKDRAEIPKENEAQFSLGKNNQLDFGVEQPLPPFLQPLQL